MFLRSLQGKDDFFFKKLWATENKAQAISYRRVTLLLLS